MNLNTGKVAWTFPAGRPIFGEALVTDSTLYFVCDNGYLFALDRLTGAERWRYDLGDARSSRILPHETVYDYEIKSPRPLLVDGVLYVGSGDSSFHAVGASTGRRRWRVAVDGKVRSSAVAYKNSVIFGTFAGGVYALDRTTGNVLWKKETYGRAELEPRDHRRQGDHRQLQWPHRRASTPTPGRRRGGCCSGDHRSSPTPSTMTARCSSAPRTCAECSASIRRTAA